MTDRGRFALLVVVAAFVLGSISAVVPHLGNAADRVTSVMGIVENVQDTVVTVARRTYDLKGIPLRDAQTGAPVDISSLRGKTVEIAFRNRKIESATVYRTLPQ